MASKRPLERLLLIDRMISSALDMIVAATFFIGWRSQVLTQACQRWRNFLALAALGIVKTSCRFMRICQACIVSRLAALGGSSLFQVGGASGPPPAMRETISFRLGLVR